jgi:phosphoglycolate phosphatase-like HAD superfamily hydrolase
MIGDTETDIQAANIRSVFVSYGYANKEEVQKLNPDVQIDHPEELILVLE